MLNFVRKWFTRSTQDHWYPLSRVPGGFFHPPRHPGAISSGEQALSLSPFYAAVNLYANQLGSLPLVTYRRGADGSRTEATDHPAYRLLKTRPNPAQSRATFFRFIAKEIFLTGNAYIVVRRDGSGNVLGLYPAPCGAVEQVVVDADWHKAYRIRLDNVAEWYDDTEVVHLFAFSEDGLQGVPVWRHAAESLGLHRQVLESANAYFANAARPSVFIRYPGKLSKEATDNLKEWLAEQGSGTLNNGKPFWLTDGGDAQTLSNGTAEDHAIIEGLAASVGDVGRWTGLSPIQLGDFSAAHYNSLQADNTYLYQRSLRPLLDSIELEFNTLLFGDDDSLHCEFDVSEILRGDPLTQSQIYSTGLAAGYYDKNEVRAELGYPPMKVEAPAPVVVPTTPTPQPQPQDANGLQDPGQQLAV